MRASSNKQRVRFQFKGKLWSVSISEFDKLSALIEEQGSVPDLHEFGARELAAPISEFPFAPKLEPTTERHQQ